MDTWSKKKDLFWRYIFIVNLWPRRVKDPAITLEELGYEEKGVLYDFNTKDLREIKPDEKIDVDLKNMGYKYLIFAPFLNEGLALIGATEKIETCSNKIITKVQIDSENLIFSVQYSPNAFLRLLIYSVVAPQDVKVSDTSVTVNWEYNVTTKILQLSITFSTSASTEITILFKD